MRPHQAEAHDEEHDGDAEQRHVRDHESDRQHRGRNRHPTNRQQQQRPPPQAAEIVDTGRRSARGRPRACAQWMVEGCGRWARLSIRMVESSTTSTLPTFIATAEKATTSAERPLAARKMEE